MKDLSNIIRSLMVMTALMICERSSAFLASNAGFATCRDIQYPFGSAHSRFGAVAVPGTENRNLQPQEESSASRMMSRLKSRLKETKSRLRKYRHPKDHQTETPQKQKPRCMPEQVVNIHDYKSKVADEKNQMVVVRFHAPYCKACQASTSPFRKLSRKYSDKIRFVECPVTAENEFLHRGLGVPSLPYGHIYHPDAGLVEEVSINKKVFKDFERILQYYVDGEGEVEYTEDGKVCVPVGSMTKPNLTP